MPIDITGLLKPKNNGQFPIYEDVDGYGGFRALTSISERNAIPDLDRKVGMLVYVSDTSKFYQLLGGTTNANWFEAEFNPSATFEVNFSGYGIIQEGLLEVNQFITVPRFVAEYSLTPDSVILSDDDGTPDKDVTSTPLEFYSDGYFQKNFFGATVTFTLSADSGDKSAVSEFEVFWGARIYFGVGQTGENTEDFILGLNSLISKDANSVFTVNAETNQKIYIAHRSGFGDITVKFNGFEGGFATVSNTISVTNQYGFSENYTLLESDYAGLGTTTIETY